MINHTDISFHDDRLKEIQSILNKLAPHEHGDGMKECNICDQPLDDAILIELRKLVSVSDFSQTSPASELDIEGLRAVMVDFVKDRDISIQKRAEYSGRMRALKGVAPAAFVSVGELSASPASEEKISGEAKKNLELPGGGNTKHPERTE